TVEENKENLAREEAHGEESRKSVGMDGTGRDGGCALDDFAIPGSRLGLWSESLEMLPSAAAPNARASAAGSASFRYSASGDTASGYSAGGDASASSAATHSTAGAVRRSGRRDSGLGRSQRRGLHRPGYSFDSISPALRCRLSGQPAGPGRVLLSQVR